MNRNIFAYTAPGSEYPGYVSINREPDGNVTITVRAAPTIHEDSIYICGFRTDKGKYGRCTPGDEHCNNYCNNAPEKGPMQDRPKSCRQVHEGKTISYTVPAIDWDRCFARAALNGGKDD